MKAIDLNGNWRVRAASKKKWGAAVVPGCIHADLLAAGMIADPFFRNHEADLQWIGRETWIYERDFATPKFAPEASVVLRCDGLDTLATISINGTVVGRADNMHRTWRFDIRDHLREEANTLTIRFDSPLAYIEKRQAERPLPGRHAAAEPAGRAWIRKMACNFGWDWSPVLTTCGIWRNIGIEVCDDARIQAFDVRQIHGEDGSIALAVDAAVENRGCAPPLTLTVRLNYKGSFVTEARTLLPENGRAHFHLKVRNAQRWWPNGLGEQPLYELVAELAGASRKPIDTCTRRIGLRTLRLERKADNGGESFQFVVNGVPFFAKGASWIPPDALITRPSRVEYARLAKAVSVANMNMLRVWGGSIYEQDWFYDLCDEYGICVWQDFMFACSTYPTFDADWMATVRVEAEQNITRLRHHACLALWCGNNGIEKGLVGEDWSERQMSWSDYARLFDDLLPSLVSALDPDRDYWPGSPHSSLPGKRTDPNDPGSGDAHLWSVWHERQPIQHYRTSGHRFCSEFGFQSFPEPRIVSSFAPAEDRHIDAPILNHHQRCVGGHAIIREYLASDFPAPKDFESTLWLSQIQQGYAMKMAVEHWRRKRPHCMGALYWQLNDCCPAVSWSSLDHEGNWKASHYFARKFFAPILVSAVEDPAAGVVEVFVHNDLRQTFKGTLQWRIGDTQGRIMRETGCPLAIDPGTVRRLGVLKMGDLLEKLTPQKLVVWLSIIADDGYVLSSNCRIFAKPKEMQIVKPDIQVEIRPWDDHCYAVTLTAERPAFWSWLEVKGCNAKFDDNFMHLSPGLPVRIRATPARNMKIDEFREALCIRSLWDTCHA